MSRVEYDVTNVLPFPLRDPAPGKQKRRRKKPSMELLPEHEQYRLYSVEELGEFPPVSWLIDRYLARGEFSVFWGEGDTYKSFLSLDWAATLASGGAPVVYIAAEGASGMKARVAAWMKHNGVAELPQLFIMPANVNMHRPRELTFWVEAIRAQLGETSPVLVVVDTLARNFVGGSENDPQDLGQFVDGVERIRREFRTSVLVIHHSTKGGDSARGNEALRNASFAMFELKRINQSLVKLMCDRMKDAERPPEVQIKPTLVPLPEFEKDEFGNEASSLVAGWSVSGRVSGRAAPSERPEKRPEVSGRQRKLLVALRGREDGRKPAELAAALKVSARTLRKELKTLSDSGLVVAEGTSHDRRYLLTEAGVEAL